ncbi:MAG TPA: right-handed parallel beta-helix repeat-containing protein [Polyangiales bacterium]|nr:right-handed parallel beta-helix repeat-containing protein [Polyangiales bacterium]
MGSGQAGTTAAGAGASGTASSGQAGSGGAAGTSPTPVPDASTMPAPDAGTEPPADSGTMQPMQPGTECAGDDGMDFALVGWAAAAGGTTGGKGGTAVTVSTGSALLQALSGKNAGTPLTIRVMGTITQANTGAEKIDVKDVQDVSIIGLGNGAELNGIGIKIFRASNVVIRNLKIHNVAIGDKDGISIEGPADHVWIDHCELYSEYPGVDKDFYDGLIDVKAESEYITYSWNNLHDSWKTMLVGSSEDDTFDRKLTIHHNVFRNCNSRMPLFRGGNGHVFNNLYDAVADTGINARIGACLLIEANVFEHSKNPWVSAFSDELGAGELRCNMTSADTTFAIAGDVHELPTCDANVPYDYAAALNHPSKVATVVNAGAGVGKLANPEQF